MRSEIKEILDKDWPDDLTGKYPRYGAYDKCRALIWLAMDGDDTNDQELFEQAEYQASIIPEPTPGMSREFIRARFPQHHIFMHGENTKILIFKEKHGTFYYVTNNAIERSKALLSVIQQRVNDGWYLDELYGDDVSEKDEDINQMDMFKRHAPPKTDMQKAKDILELARSGEPGTLIRAGKMAFEYLNSHSDREYEEFEIEYPTEIKFSLTST